MNKSKMTTSHIQVADWQQYQHALADIRNRVFVQEQQVPVADEWDGLDESATHFIVRLESGEIVGCARLLTELLLTELLLTEQGVQDQVFHIGRVAIRKPFRGQGLGLALMRFILQHCQQLAPANPIYLHAQCERQAFYEVLGFVVHGEVFMDAGIPHISMWYTATEE
jgi:predicted GNAT family N-acyltransferase